MKKLLVLLMVLALVATSMFACSNNNENNNGNNNVNNEAGDDNETPDVVTTASLVTDADAFVNAMSADGTWIVATYNDITLEEDLVVEGEFTHREEIARKIGLYTQDDDRNVTERFTLTVPNIIVKSENLRIQSGVVVGDIYVEATGFQLVDQKVEGNVYYASQAIMDAATIDENSEVTGKVEIGTYAASDAPDVVTTASLVTDADAFAKAMSADGTWIVATYNDITLDEELVVEGEFTHREEIARKIGLYTQDDDRNVTARFTLTVPKITVKSENLKIQSGVVVGDIYVEANGFQLADQKVEGNIYFASQEYMDSFVMDENSEVTGSMEVQ